MTTQKTPAQIAANRKRKLQRLWDHSDLTIPEICEEMEMSEPDLLAYAQSLGFGERQDPEIFMPTPEEIRLAAAAIRATWSQSERESRLGGRAPVRLRKAPDAHN